MNRGIWFEKEVSKNISKDEIPFLISSKLLRIRDLGQVDFAKLKKNNTIYIYELKWSSFPSKIQYKRLRKTQDFLSRVMETNVEMNIKLCKKQNDYLCY